MLRPSMFRIAVTNRQTGLALDRRRLRRAVEMILRDAGIEQADISLAVVDDAAIHRLNRQFLGHDWPTDVLSFVLDRADWWLAGEVVVSADAAWAAAAEYGWPPEDELLLYVVHGALHLVGYEDATRAGRARMRQRERACLARFGLVARFVRPHRKSRWRASAGNALPRRRRGKQDKL